MKRCVQEEQCGLAHRYHNSACTGQARAGTTEGCTTRAPDGPMYTEWDSLDGGPWRKVEKCGRPSVPER